MTIENKYETLELSVENGIGELTISREKSLNALNSKLLSELKHILTALKSETLTGLIVTGAGSKAFIAGADIKEMQDMAPDEAREFGALGQEVSVLFENLPYPTIACVNGFALGGGCEMALACDFIYATQTAVFGQPEVKLGLIPGFGGTQRLSRVIGRNFAKEIIYTGRNVKADEAEKLGLIVKAYGNKNEMLHGARATLEEVSKVGPLAVSLSKKVMNSGNDMAIELGLAQELEQFSAVFASEDMKEGTSAFVEKRAPEFKGK